MKRKIISYTIGILGCIIIDTGFIAMAVTFNTSRPFYDYIILGIFILLEDFLFLTLVSVCFEKPENKCLVIKLPSTVDDDSLPKLK